MDAFILGGDRSVPGLQRLGVLPDARRCLCFPRMWRSERELLFNKCRISVWTQTCPAGGQHQQMHSSTDVLLSDTELCAVEQLKW